MPCFIVLAQLKHCFLEEGGEIHPPGHRKPKKPGLNRVNEAKTNICLSPTVGFLNENDGFAYFTILGNCR